MINLNDISIGAIVSEEVKEKVDGGVWKDLGKAVIPGVLPKRYKHKFCSEIPKEELEKRLAEIAESYGVDKEEVLKSFGSLDVVEYDMKMHKALEILKENN